MRSLMHRLGNWEGSSVEILSMKVHSRRVYSAEHVNLSHGLFLARPLIKFDLEHCSENARETFRLDFGVATESTRLLYIREG